MIKKIAKKFILNLSIILFYIFSIFFVFSVAHGSDDVNEIKRELKEIRSKLKLASGSDKSRLMKRMAKLENKLTESFSADRKQSK